MVVEDSPTMRQLIAGALQRIDGMFTIEAANGVEALRKLADGAKPDIILTDINMPIMDGLKLVKRVPAVLRGIGRLVWVIRVRNR